MKVDSSIELQMLNEVGQPYFHKYPVICRLLLLEKRDRIFWLWDRLSQIIATRLNKGSVTKSPSLLVVVTEVVLNYKRISFFKS